VSELDGIEDLAREYYTADRQRQKEIAGIVKSYTAVQAIYFCQQLVSHESNVHLASMHLTILANRV
jgi:hypothetical protein